MCLTCITCLSHDIWYFPVIENIYLCSCWRWNKVHSVTKIYIILLTFQYNIILSTSMTVNSFFQTYIKFGFLCVRNVLIMHVAKLTQKLAVLWVFRKLPWSLNTKRIPPRIPGLLRWQFLLSSDIPLREKNFTG